MKILFISSGNSGQMSPIIHAQAQSLREEGITVEHFLIEGKGILGYLKNVPKLRSFLQQNTYTVVHAHYSLSAYVATLVGVKKLIVSLMGSDVKANTIAKSIIKITAALFWKTTIVKSEENYNSLGYKKAIILPNGVNILKFHEMDRAEAQQQLQWSENKIHLLFAANPERSVKNFDLVEKSIKTIANPKIEVHFLKNIPHNQIPLHLNAADGILLSSLWEGSPNVIKEAMACNKPIVSTNVGDVKQVFGAVEGCYLSDFEVENYVNAIEKMLLFIEEKRNIKGRQQIKQLGLTATSIANQLIGIYK